MRHGLEAEVARINKLATKDGQPSITLLPKVAGDGQEGIEKQIRQMKELIALRPDVIIVQPTDNAALAEPLREANRIGIPVIAYDQYVSGGSLAGYVTSDNYQAGYLDGEYLAARFAGAKPMKLVLVEYPHVSSTVERLDGFLDALQASGKEYQVLKSYRAVQPAEGRLAGQAMLRDFPSPGSIDAVFTVNDGGGLGVIDVLARAGRHEIAVASIDGDPASVDNIRTGRMTLIDSAQFCGPLGAEAAKLAYAAARGQVIPRHTVIPVFPVTAETLASYPGWQGPIPDTFKKPWPSRHPQWDNRPRMTR